MNLTSLPRINSRTAAQYKGFVKVALSLPVCEVQIDPVPGHLLWLSEYHPPLADVPECQSYVVMPGWLLG